MENNQQALKDVYHQRTIFFQIGLIMSLSFVMIAFEWKFYDDSEQVDLKVNHTSTIILDNPFVIEETRTLPTPAAIKEGIIVKSGKAISKIQKIEEQLALIHPLDIKTDIQPTDSIIKKSIPPPPPMTDCGLTCDYFLIEENFPTPKEGMKTFYEYLSKNIQYPRKAREQGIQGKVQVQFVVGKDGKFTDFKILEGVGGGCDEEALRVLKDAPAWNAGKQRGRPVRVQMSIPISFMLINARD